MSAEGKTVTLGEILPPPCLKRLLTFVDDYQQGKLNLHSDEDVRQAVKRDVLLPYSKELAERWNLDYLSYALCYALCLT